MSTAPTSPTHLTFADNANAPVDSHFHLFVAGQAIAQARYRPAYGADWSTWQAQAEAVGVLRGVLVQTSFLGTDNRQLLSELAAHPHALRGIAVIAPDTDWPTLQAMHHQGVRGIRLNLAGQSHDLSAWCAQAQTLWPSLAALGWHVELHTDQGALPAVLRQLPADLTLVLDHFAKPARADRADETVQAVLARRRLGPVHIKLSGAYRLGDVSPRELAAIWLAELGAAALLWGSDWPCTNHEDLADYASLHHALHDWVDGDTTAQRAILVDNPQRLYA